MDLINMHGYIDVFSNGMSFTSKNGCGRYFSRKKHTFVRLVFVALQVTLQLLSRVHVN